AAVQEYRLEPQWRDDRHGRVQASAHTQRAATPPRRQAAKRNRVVAFPSPRRVSLLTIKTRKGVERNGDRAAMCAAKILSRPCLLWGHDRNGVSKPLCTVSPGTDIFDSRLCVACVCLMFRYERLRTM